MFLDESVLTIENPDESTWERREDCRHVHPSAQLRQFCRASHHLVGDQQRGQPSRHFACHVQQSPQDTLKLPEFKNQFNFHTEQASAALTQAMATLARLDGLAMLVAMEVATHEAFVWLLEHRKNQVQKLSPMADLLVDDYESWQDALFL